MAQNKENILTKGMSGTIARMLTFRQKAGKTIVSKLRRATPASNSDKASAVRVKFSASVEYAKKAIKDDATKALYQLLAKEGKSAFNVATADAFNPPTVDSITTTNYHGVVGDNIIVRKSDPYESTGKGSVPHARVLSKAEKHRVDIGSRQRFHHQHWLPCPRSSQRSPAISLLPEPCWLPGPGSPYLRISSPAEAGFRSPPALSGRVFMTFKG